MGEGVPDSRSPSERPEMSAIISHKQSSMPCLLSFAIVSSDKYKAHVSFRGFGSWPSASCINRKRRRLSEGVRRSSCSSSVLSVSAAPDNSSVGAGFVGQEHISALMATLSPSEEPQAAQSLSLRGCVSGLRVVWIKMISNNPPEMLHLPHVKHAVFLKFIHDRLNRGEIKPEGIGVV